MNRLNLASIDWILMIPIAILITFSLATLYTINVDLFRSQLIFTVFSFFIFLALTQLNPTVLKQYSIPIYAASLVILALVLVIGVESRGSVRWIEFLGFRAQFSEILKPFLALALASYLSDLNSYSLRSFLTILLFLAPVFLLIYFQPDLGNALIYAIVTLTALLIYGFPFRWFLLGFTIWLASLPFFWLIIHEYQRQRILTFLDPNKDPLGTSYNAIQAVIAVGSGMIIGKGLGQGTQAGLSFLPEQHTDFIFATISEELGLIGALVILGSFGFLFFRLYHLVRASENSFAKMFSVIVFLVIFVHFVVNVGMNIGLVPVVGVTLPFVSYGGSSLLSNFVLLGLLFAVNKKSRSKVLEIG